jgi:hypothetical protein
MHPLHNLLGRFFMSKINIVIIGFGLVFCNMVAAVLLFAIPAKERPEASREPVTSVTTTLERVASSSETRTPSQPSPRLGEGDTTPSAMLGEGRSEVRTVTKSKVATTSKQVSDNTPLLPIRIPILTAGTVLDAMQTFATASSSFSFDGKDYPGLGFFVEVIEGRKAADGHSWILYVNEKTADRGASQQHVSPEDTVEWRYEKNIY